ncbi:MAG: PrgI family protein [Eubacteriales bacterium]
MNKIEVKIPREIRDYQETIFFGLTMRQFICSAIAAGIAIFSFFSLRDVLGNEGVSWVCILSAMPAAGIGFVKYHGMTFEYFVWVYIKSEFIMPKRLWFESDNYMYMAYQEFIKEKNIKVKRKGEQENVKHVQED